jgi:excisionase family DNA binding protein
MQAKGAEARMQVEWLSLGEVAQILGVHPSTARNWSNQGILPVHRTSGGHRRYLRSEVDLWMQAQRGDGSNEVDLIVQNALRNTRFKISEGRLNAESWYARLDEAAREQYRASGRTLLQGLINAMNAEEKAFLAEAEALGSEYAGRGRRFGLSVTEAVSAFLFFRNMLLEAMLGMYEAAAVRSPHAWSNMFRRINQFTDQILLTILETYDAYQRALR